MRLYRIGFLAVLSLAIWQTAIAIQPALKDYAARIPLLRTQISAVVESAENAANSTMGAPDSRIACAQNIDDGFAQELAGRAGGLANIGGIGWYGKTDHDIILIPVRSWEKQRNEVVRLIKEYHANGWTVTVFGSAVGKPDDLGADYFADNGAPTPGADQGRINILANVTLGWMWVCEYAAALSKEGVFPGILYSIGMAGGIEYDKTLQTGDGRYILVPCPKEIEAGDLAEQYLKRAEKVIADCSSDHVQGQLTHAADLIAARMKAGGRVGLSGTGHANLNEIELDRKSPWMTFQAAGSCETAYKKNMNPGEMLVWIGYAGVNTVGADHGKYMTEAGVQPIYCVAPDPNWSKDAPPPLAVIDQMWALPDACIPIPIFPRYIAAISGLYQCVLFRMLDDEVSDRLQRK